MLTGALLVAGFDGVFSSDEGAGILQARAVDDGWSIQHPFPEVDPEGRWHPLEKSARTNDGGYAPLPKKPLYSVLNAAADRVLGVRGMGLVSVVGTMVAAGFAALIARTVDPVLDRPTLWLTGLGTPLLADGLLVIGHAVGAAVAGALVWASLHFVERPGARRVPLIVGLAALGPMIRNESILLTAAVAVVLALGGLVRRRRVQIGASLVVGAGAVVGVVIDQRWTSALFERASFISSAGLGSGGGGTPSISDRLDDRWTGFVTSWLRPGYGTGDVAQMVGLLVLVLGAAVVWSVRRERHDARVVGHLAVLLGALAVARVVVPGPSPDVVPGLLVACPFVLWGLAGLEGRSLRLPRVVELIGVFGVFAAGVIVSQYRGAGAWEWGGRYFAVGLPVIAPAITLGLRDLLRRVSLPNARLLVTAWLMVALALGITAVAAVRESRARSGELVDSVVLIASQTSPGSGALPVIISTEPELPRTAWDRLGDARWFYARPSDVDTLLERLDDANVGELVIATRRAVATAASIGGSAFSDPTGVAVPESSGWWFVRLVRQ